MTSPLKNPGKRVCVIGTGVLGLVAIKNLKEQGLDVTAFERNDEIGGTWNTASGKPGQVTATELTTSNTSKQVNCFTDFPFPDAAATHPSSKDIGDYLVAYANHFDLLRHIQFSTKVAKAERDNATGQWIIDTESFSTQGAPGTQKHTFDRVVVATGIFQTRKMVDIPGIEKFQGDFVHSREFKDPHRYAGKNVMVIGIGATGADTTSFLKRVGAAKIYLSHRSQTYLLPRVVQGKAFDHSMSYRMGCIMRFISGWTPKAFLTLMTKGMQAAQQKAFPWLKSHTSFSAPRPLPGAPMLYRIPIFSDDLAHNLRDGIVQSVVGVREVTGPHTVMLTDGSTVDNLDAIVVCSGYRYDFSVVPGAGNPVDPAKATDGYRRIRAAPHYEDDNPFPRLYRGFISEQFPDSLAFLGHLVIMGPAWVTYDLATMALASLWSGGGGAAPAALPTAAQIEADIEAHYQAMIDALHVDKVTHLGIRMRGGETFDWLNNTAGTGLPLLLGSFSLAACKLWWRDRRFYNLLMDGLNAPAVYRLFDNGGGGRAPWPGARAHIEKVNAEVKEMGDKWRQEEKAKPH
ncbi:hypothetical protein PFICI_03704 [Pestalotiopsis fici W106-1]|uniref:Uncharacterized protein n=1 Tax=Pestalotiopsis fici (strain W106-1 / CGMCC3.15140) TaxID=1229662 RepID=W3XI48_PESFW|nr:uncharacterized protein PFICI_03704 [Pestalotiopsis fici W106-1]ETS85679.1 hypothetical protein PFICI_03704 [Pestalotiopsis fici W106-1]